jgi:hypothetical protein
MKQQQYTITTKHNKHNNQENHQQTNTDIIADIAGKTDKPVIQDDIYF